MTMTFVSQTPKKTHAMQLQGDRTIGLRIRLGDTLAHEIKEGKLRRAGSKLVHEAAGEVRAENRAEVVVRNLSIRSISVVEVRDGEG
jgi:hypothetical protein